MSFSTFEHGLIDFFKKQPVTKAYTVACSGGLDSVVLVSALVKIKPVFKFNLQILHVHHGVSIEKPEQSAYRNNAIKFVENLASKNSLKFSFSKAPAFLDSEEDCRDFRLKSFEGFENVLTAHHKDDFLETLMLRMIRGSGAQGLVSPFKEQSLKPFLSLFSQIEIKDYAAENKVNWTSDPSNLDSDPLRNWVRNEWLPQLDNKIGKEGFEKSLMLISQAMSNVTAAQSGKVVIFKSDREGCFQLADWLALDRFQKQSMIAHILLKVRKTGYTHGQIEEVVKQLDQIKKDATFRSGKLKWIKSRSKVEFALDNLKEA